MGEVYKMLTSQGEKTLDSYFQPLDNTHPAKAPYALFQQASETVRSGVIIGLGSRLQVFQSELIKKITTTDEIDLELPGQKPCAYFLVTSDQDSTFDFLASLFLSFVFIKLVRYADKNCEGGRLSVPVHILGEELTACGTIPDLSRRLSVIRSRNISMSCVFQNLAGLQNRYPYNLWQEIIGNCDVQLFLGCTDPLTAEFVSDRTGLASVAVTSATIPGLSVFLMISVGTSPEQLTFIPSILLTWILPPPMEQAWISIFSPWKSSTHIRAVLGCASAISVFLMLTSMPHSSATCLL